MHNVPKRNDGGMNASEAIAVRCGFFNSGEVDERTATYQKL